MGYNFGTGIITLSRNNARRPPDEFLCSVGEEIGHLLHHRGNPEIFEAWEMASTKLQEMGEDVDEKSVFDATYLINWIEMIGNYAGYVYYENIRPYNVNELAKKSLSNLMKDFTRVDQNTGSDEVKHMIGYMGACWHYLKFGDSKLSELARLSSSEAIGYVTGLEMSTEGLL